MDSVITTLERGAVTKKNHLGMFFILVDRGQTF